MLVLLLIGCIVFDATQAYIVDFDEVYNDEDEDTPYVDTGMARVRRYRPGRFTTMDPEELKGALKQIMFGRNLDHAFTTSTEYGLKRLASESGLKPTRYDWNTSRPYLYDYDNITMSTVGYMMPVRTPAKVPGRSRPWRLRADEDTTTPVNTEDVFNLAKIRVQGIKSGVVQDLPVAKTTTTHNLLLEILEDVRSMGDGALKQMLFGRNLDNATRAQYYDDPKRIESSWMGFFTGVLTSPTTQLTKEDPTTALKSTTTSTERIDDPTTTLKSITTSMERIDDPTTTLKSITTSMEKIDDPTTALKSTTTSMERIDDLTTSLKSTTTSMERLDDPTTTLKSTTTSMENDLTTALKSTTTSMEKIDDLTATLKSTTTSMNPTDTLNSTTTSMNPTTTLNSTATSTILSVDMLVRFTNSTLNRTTTAVPTTTPTTTASKCTDEQTTEMTTRGFDIEKFLEIIANLTYDYYSNLTDQVSETLVKMSVPTCGTPTTPVPSTTTRMRNLPDYSGLGKQSLKAKCFVCGLEEAGIPFDANCADAFAGDFIPLVPQDPRAKRHIANFRKYCRYKDVNNFVLNSTMPRSIFGRWSGGCSVRWTDVTGVYTQRSCRNRFHATTGRHFASKRMAKLEMTLQSMENGCIISPVATLLPLSRGISLFSRFHACVCTGSWCNASFWVDSDMWMTYVVALTAAFALGVH